MSARRMCLVAASSILWVAVVAPPARVASQQAAAAPAVDPTRSPRLMVGVVRNDGILLPFAAFDGKKWSRPWPGTVDGPFGSASRELPASLDAVPRGWWGGEVPGAWRVWPRGAGAARPLTLVAPGMAMVGRIRQLGFRTDQPPVPPPVPPFELPFPKVGIAVAGHAQLEPIPSVSPLSAAWKTFNASLQPEIDGVEERSIKAIRSSTQWRHPVAREARARMPAALEAWYLTELPEAGQRLSYVEAVKKYPLLPEDDGCGLETFVSGWVHHDERRTAPKTTFKAVISYCDRRNVSYMLPFGQLRLAGRNYWLFQMSGYDHELYAVVEGAPGRVKYVVEYLAGRAPS